MKWLDSNYCASEEWRIVKTEEEKKWQNKGYLNVKCSLVKSDTKGLRMYVVTNDN